MYVVSATRYVAILKLHHVIANKRAFVPHYCQYLEASVQAVLHLVSPHPPPRAHSVRLVDPSKLPHDYCCCRSERCLPSSRAGPGLDQALDKPVCPSQQGIPSYLVPLCTTIYGSFQHSINMQEVLKFPDRVLNIDFFSFFLKSITGDHTQ